MDTLGLDFWRRYFSSLSAVFESEKERLCGLDGAIGDGDHGASMAMGFSEASKRLSGGNISDAGDLLKVVGNAFMGTVGGVTGVIFGTLFISAGKQAEGKTEIDVDDLAVMFESALETIKQKGKAKEGDKSMVDALSPAVTALKEATEKKNSLKDALISAQAAAEKGMEATRGLVAKTGRARYQGEKSIGHIDAGAASTALIFKILAQTEAT